MSAVQQVVDAQQFRIVGPDGRARCILGVDADAQPCVLLFDNDGQVRLSIYLDADGRPSVVLGNHRGQSILGLTDQAGVRGLYVANDEDVLRCVLALRREGFAYLDLLDGQQRNRLTVEVSPHGVPTSAMRDIGRRARGFRFGTLPRAAWG